MVSNEMHAARDQIPHHKDKHGHSSKVNIAQYPTQGDSTFRRIPNAVLIISFTTTYK